MSVSGTAPGAVAHNCASFPVLWAMTYLTAVLVSATYHDPSAQGSGRAARDPAWDSGRRGLIPAVSCLASFLL